MTTTTYKVPADNFPGLVEQIEKLNKKVAKLVKKGYAATPISFVKDETPVIEKYHVLNAFGERVERERIFFNVTVTGETVQANGWDFIATLQHEEGGTIVRSVPGLTTEGELVPFRDAEPVCNHCGWNRRRNDTFIVRKGTEYKQIGRNCLADFFGFDPHAAAAMAEILASVHSFGQACEDDEFLGGDRPKKYFTISEYLPYVAWAIRTSGWLSKGKAYEAGNVENATACVAERQYNENAAKWRNGEEPQERFVPTEADVAVAKKTIEGCATFFEEANEATLSDYEHNLRVAMMGGVCDPKTFGIVASSINFLARQEEKKAERVDFTNSQYVGEIGKRQVFKNLKCVYPGFGGRPVVFVDEAGNKVSCWNASFACDKGGVYTLKATPVKHDEYKGIKSTMINRVALATEKDLAAKPKRVRKATKVEKCAACKEWEKTGRPCTAASHGECDCPKCQGLCVCDK